VGGGWWASRKTKTKGLEKQRERKKEGLWTEQIPGGKPKKVKTPWKKDRSGRLFYGAGGVTMWGEKQRGEKKHPGENKMGEKTGRIGFLKQRTGEQSLEITFFGSRGNSAPKVCKGEEGEEREWGGGRGKNHFGQRVLSHVHLSEMTQGGARPSVEGKESSDYRKIKKNRITFEM